MKGRVVREGMVDTIGDTVYADGMPSDPALQTGVEVSLAKRRHPQI